MKAYILKLTFEGIVPEVWRKVVIPAGATFNRLHETIQNVTNFKSHIGVYHYFSFPLEDVIITNSEDMIQQKEVAGKQVKQPTRIKIDKYLEEDGQLLYQYDFADDWKIKIVLEEIVEDYYFGYPTILDGAGMAPPEGVGGPEAYMEFLKVIHDSTHPEYREKRAWAETMGYNPLDLDAINQNLKTVKFKKTEWEHIDHENYLILSDKYRGSEVARIEDIPNRELLLKYIISCTNLYGVVPFYKIVKIYNLQNRPSVSKRNLYAIISDSHYASVLKEKNIIVENGRFIHETLKSYNLLEPLEQVAIGKPYYIPEKEELLRYEDETYYEKTKYQLQLANLIERDFKGQVSAQKEIDNLVGKLQIVNVNFNFVVKNFMERFVFEYRSQINEYTKLIMEIANTTRLWENRGFTPKELFELSKPRQSKVLVGGKVGRNEPCPCGSGKKYKKCCGR